MQELEETARVGNRAISATRLIEFEKSLNLNVDCGSYILQSINVTCASVQLK